MADLWAAVEVLAAAIDAQHTADEPETQTPPEPTPERSQP